MIVLIILVIILVLLVQFLFGLKVERFNDVIKRNEDNIIEIEYTDTKDPVPISKTDTLLYNLANPLSSVKFFEKTTKYPIVPKENVDYLHDRKTIDELNNNKIDNKRIENILGQYDNKNIFNPRFFMQDTYNNSYLRL